MMAAWIEALALYRGNGDEFPLPLAGEGWGGGAGQATDIARLEFPHPPQAAYAPPQAGEVGPSIGTAVAQIQDA
jgi:hypothetical protein